MVSQETKVYLAFDFGTRNIGVAIGQKLTKTATPLEPLLAKDGEPDWSKVDKLIAEWKPAALVVGVPFKLDGGVLPVTAKAKKFISELRARFHLQVHEAEERLTTKAAREEIFARGGYKALQDESVDGVAAQLILEEWMSGGD